MTTTIRNNQLNLLARRVGYNLALRHFRTAQSFAADVGDGYNLAGVLNAALQSGEIEGFQARPVINILLAEKYGYAYGAQNLRENVENVKALVTTINGWNNIHFVLVYTDANTEVHIIDPTTEEHWEPALPLAKDEFLVCYAGTVADARSDEVLDSAVGDFFSLLYGGKPRAKSAYRSSTNLKKKVEPAPAPEPEQEAEEGEGTAAEASAPEPVAATGPRKVTGKIAVNVTNELFHNGNVEAWKRIILSYRLSHPGTDVLVWYEGERINDINALFKWGKVKHGTPIMFSVAGGEHVTDIVKLRKYLFEGASQRFEAFLHGAPGTVLKLF